MESRQNFKKKYYFKINYEICHILFYTSEPKWLVIEKCELDFTSVKILKMSWTFHLQDFSSMSQTISNSNGTLISKSTTCLKCFKKILLFVTSKTVRAIL